MFKPYFLYDVKAAVDRALQIVGMIGSISPGGSLSPNLLKRTRAPRHIHLLPLAQTPVLQYCTHLILSALQVSIKKFVLLIYKELL